MKTIMKGIPILFIIMILLSITPLTAISSQGDVFTVDSMEFKVLTESVTMTVQVGDGSNVVINNNTTGELNIPNSVLWNGRTYTVTGIGDWAFRDCTKLTSVTIPNSVTSIGKYAFYSCNSLTRVTIPESVINISDRAFFLCTSLTKVTIPKSVTSIGSKAFGRCGRLTNIDVRRGNPAYSSKNGVLFNKAMTLLHTYPGGKVGAYTIPKVVTIIGDYAFFDCRNLTSVTIPNSVISIGNEAFNCCSSLENLSVPNSVTSIGDYAFGGCSRLASIIIGNSVTRIGRNAFSYCSRLMNIDVSPGNPSYFSEDGVLFNKAMTLLHTYPGGKVGAYTIPNSVTSIGDFAFLQCSNLKSVIIPNSVTNIGESAFLGCNNLTSIIIPDSLTSIANHVFNHCNNLTKVWFEGNAPIIGSPNVGPGVFYSVATGAAAYVYKDATGFSAEGQKWNGLIVRHRDAINTQPTENTTVTQGSATVSAETDDFFTVDNIQYRVLSESGTTGTAQIGDGSNSAINSNITGVFSIPATVLWNERTYTVTNIGDRALYDCSSLTNVTIPDSVTSIGESAFWYCSNLTGVTIPNSVISIGKYAFIGCSSLTSVIFGNSVTSIGDWIFGHCSSLTSVTIPDSVTSIGSAAFNNCMNLMNVDVSTGNPEYFSENGVLFNKAMTLLHTYPGGKVGAYTIPNSVTSIGDWAFNCCSSLTSVTIPDSVTNIGRNAFSDCSRLASVTIPNSVTSIGGAAFSGCSNLTIVIIPNSVTSIGGTVFFECSSLTSVTIPNSVTSIGDRAFNGCSSLTSVAIPDSVTSISSNAFGLCSSLMSVDVSSGNPEYFSENGVLFNKSMTLLHTYPGGKVGAYTIPNSVTSIGDWAFTGCSSLTSVTIPDSVTRIGDYAFSGCLNLTEVWFDGDAPTVDRNAFHRYNLATGTIAYVNRNATGFPMESQLWNELTVWYRVN